MAGPKGEKENQSRITRGNNGRKTKRKWEYALHSLSLFIHEEAVFGAVTNATGKQTWYFMRALYIHRLPLFFERLIYLKLYTGGQVMIE